MFKNLFFFSFLIMVFSTISFAESFSWGNFFRKQKQEIEREKIEKQKQEKEAAWQCMRETFVGEYELIEQSVQNENRVYGLECPANLNVVVDGDYKFSLRDANTREEYLSSSLMNDPDYFPETERRRSQSGEGYGSSSEEFVSYNGFETLDGWSYQESAFFDSYGYHSAKYSVRLLDNPIKTIQIEKSIEVRYRSVCGGVNKGSATCVYTTHEPLN